LYNEIRKSFYKNIPGCLGVRFFSKKGIILRDRLNKPKFSLNNKDRPGVYKIPCANCKNFYIGQTGRTISTRIHEHSRSVKSNSSISSAVKDHSHVLKHTIDFNNTEPIFYSNSLMERLIIEAYYIKRSNVFVGNKCSYDLLVF